MSKNEGNRRFGEKEIDTLLKDLNQLHERMHYCLRKKKKCPTNQERRLLDT